MTARLFLAAAQCNGVDPLPAAEVSSTPYVPIKSLTI